MKIRSKFTLLVALIPAILAIAFLLFWQKTSDESTTTSTATSLNARPQAGSSNNQKTNRLSTPESVQKRPIQTQSITYPTTGSSQSPLGINTNELFEQDASIPFIDLFRAATPFHENIRCRAKDQPCLTSAQVEYDQQGWPKKLNGGKAGVFFLRNIPIEALPQGDYSVLYDGKGEIEYLQNVEVVSRHKGEDVIRFTARADNFMTAALHITQSDPSHPLKNIRIIMPGGICSDNPFKHVASATSCRDSDYLDFKTYYASITFNPDYLDFMKDFGVVRFMPMSGITRNPVEQWEQRNKMDKATWGGIYGSRGAPLEIQIKLANLLNADPWLNVPHAADDNYMRQFASYVKAHLSSKLTPHIEYTNEAWNSNFVHNEHMQKMGIAQKLDQDALQAGYKFYAKRSVEFFNIWQDVHGRDDPVVRIIGGWDTRPDIGGIILAYNNTYESVDALAIAPYVGGNLRGFRAAKTVDDIFHLLTDEQSYRSLPKIIEEIGKQAKLAHTFGVRLIAYEGGQGLVDWATKDYTQHPNPLFFASNRDPRMTDLYNDLYQQWRGVGADLFVAFSAPRSCNWSGCWGLKEHIRQDPTTAPKLVASLNFINENKRWWDWSTPLQKPASREVAKYLQSTPVDKPRIVIRPAKGDPDTFYRFVNPQALNILVEGDTWDKRDLSGKWQVKWDDNNIYLSVKVYDKEAISDSTDPRDDDSIEFFIDGDNSRGDVFDKKNDFHIIFARNKAEVFYDKNNPDGKKLHIPFEMEEKYDGYELRAEISWNMLGLSPKIADKMSMDVIINDDDDGGARDARVSWNARNSDIQPKDLGMILVSGR